MLGGQGCRADTPTAGPMLCLGALGWQPGVLTGDGFFPA